MTKKNIINSKLREETYIRFCFGIEENFEMAGIRKAYLDFCRTLPNEDDRTNNKIIAEKYLLEELKKIINKDISSFLEFDIEHEKIIKTLIYHWEKLKIGHAQKWVNMTLKYWLLLGEGRIPNIEKNANFFHIPIDGITLREITKKETNPAWSKINCYIKYLELQKTYRKDKKTPILNEFFLFNKTRI